MVRKYKILSAALCSSQKAKEGDIVYGCIKPDYGCASMDTNHTGREYVAVTYKSDGDYPFFTAPFLDLEEVTE